jgi:predicted ATPase
VPPHATYLFKHALVQDAAYGTLLREPRRTLHARIAEIIESEFADSAESRPELLARHFTEAGLSESAVEYWFKAAKRAESRSANIEAVRALAQGIEIIQSLPPSLNRTRKELDFYLALGPAMAATQGYAASETLNAFLHANRLLADDGTPTEQMTVFWGAYMAHTIRAEHVAARNVANQILALGAEQRHPGLLALGNRFLGQTLWMMGGFVDARAHLERTIEICAANEETITSYRKFGADDQVNASSGLSRTLWVLGYPEKATELGEKAVARARSLGLPFTTGHALDGEALLGILGADLQRAEVHANEALNHSIKHSLADLKQRALFILGVLLTKRGDLQQGIELMQSAIAAIERTNHRNRRTLYLGHIAAAHASLGHSEIGLSLLNDAVQTVEATSERFFEAELYRLRGELLLLLEDRDRAEEEFRRALAVARQQQARSWELRAAMSIAWLWREQGKRDEARELLAPLYGWFTEGFDTLDLKQAKTLLDELHA